jgi:hypothetical protein
MIETNCPHSRRVTGILNCDLARPGYETSLYSAQLELKVCESCGHVEIWSKAHHDLCSWLREHPASSTQRNAN